jgi:hypothetical protein
MPTISTKSCFCKKNRLEMAITNGILDIVGAGIERSIRVRFARLTRVLFSYVSMDTIQSLFTIFGRGDTLEEEAACHAEFEAAKLGGAASLSDRNARSMALRYADKFGTNAPIEAVIVCLDMLETIHEQKMSINPSNADALLEESLDKIETSHEGIFVYVRNILNK